MANLNESSTTNEAEVIDGAPEAEETPSFSKKAADDSPAPKSAEEAMSDLYDKLMKPKGEPREEDESVGEQPSETDAKKEKVDVPDTWANKKDEWTSMGEAARQAVAAAEQSYQKRIDHLSSQVEQSQPLVDLVNQYRDTFVGPDGKQMDPVTAVKALIKLNNVARKDPYAVIEQIAATYNVDLRKYKDVDPEIRSRDIKLLQHELKEEDAQREQRHQNSNTMITQIQKWSEDKKHFNDVYKEMMAVLPSKLENRGNKDTNTLLDEAYSDALWANPKTREILLAEQKAEEKKAEMKKKRTTDAAKAGALNLGSRRSDAGQLPKDFNRRNMDHMSALYDDITSRLDKTS